MCTSTLGIVNHHRLLYTTIVSSKPSSPLHHHHLLYTTIISCTPPSSPSNPLHRNRLLLSQRRHRRDYQPPSLPQRSIILVAYRMQTHMRIAHARAPRSWRTFKQHKMGAGVHQEQDQVAQQSVDPGEPVSIVATASIGRAAHIIVYNPSVEYMHSPSNTSCSHLHHSHWNFRAWALCRHCSLQAYSDMS